MPKSKPSTEKTSSIVFEYPLQENIRGFLRLEALFIQARNNIRVSNKDNHFHALKILFELLEILERGDTRSELIKELSRLLEYFKELEANPEVDTSKLTQFLKQINQLHQWVHSHQGKFGESIRKDQFIQNVRRRCSIPGGSCQFDSPDLCLFLNQKTEDRQSQLDQWLSQIKGVETSIEVILRLLRDNSDWLSEKAPIGSFVIEATEPAIKLLRIRKITGDNLFPELSSGKHRSNIHFMHFKKEHKKKPANTEVMFELACCR